MKKCFKCGRNKPLSMFYKHGEMSDGHLGKCKSCTKKDVHTRYNDPNTKIRITEYEKARFQDPERKKKVLEYQRKRRLKHPNKNRARAKASKLEKLPCQVCGNIIAEAHHPDYRKPLDVIWLCFKHHRELHKKII